MRSIYRARNIMNVLKATLWLLGCMCLWCWYGDLAVAGGMTSTEPVPPIAPPAAASTGDRTRSAMQRLTPLIGQWQGEFRVPATQWDPEQRSAMRYTGRWMLNENHIEGLLDYAFEGASRTVNSHWSFDRDTREYVLHWIDNTSTQATVYRGKFIKPDELLMTTSRLFQDKTVEERLRVRFSDPNGWSMISENNLFGGFSEGGRFTANKHE